MRPELNRLTISRRQRRRASRPCGTVSGELVECDLLVKLQKVANAELLKDLVSPYDVFKPWLL